mmetsp:Transcript_27914/g.47760  ORF Transcript_27914/g.47760 Transcript_27914/m.47760 type:complete len:211 (-) Transcript_27914:459-1091(-)
MSRDQLGYRTHSSCALLSNNHRLPRYYVLRVIQKSKSAKASLTIAQLLTSHHSLISIVPHASCFVNLAHGDQLGCLAHTAHVHDGLVVSADLRRMVQHQQLSLKLPVGLRSHTTVADCVRGQQNQSSCRSPATALTQPTARMHSILCIVDAFISGGSGGDSSHWTFGELKGHGLSGTGAAHRHVVEAKTGHHHRHKCSFASRAQQQSLSN